MVKTQKAFPLLLGVILLSVFLAGIMPSACALIPSPASSTPAAAGATEATFSPLSSPASATESTIAPTPSVTNLSPTVQQSPFPTPTSTPAFTPYVPTGMQQELFNYMLGLINQDRQTAGLSPVVLGFNAAAQQHAQDMFDNYFISHWGTDGFKPYMRYTLAGGTNYEQENSAYSGWFDPSQNPDQYMNIDVKQELQYLESEMMYDDAGSNWGHRDNILNKWHKRVNLGIAYDEKRVALVEQFEGDYVDFDLPPELSGDILSLSGNTNLGSINSVFISYDRLPRPLTHDELLYVMPHSYSLGSAAGLIVSPPPPGQYYTSLPPEAIVATRWETGQSGRFAIQADISAALAAGSGVYTVSIISEIDGEAVSLTNYSIFAE